MDDTFRSVLFGFLGLLVVHASLERRVSHDATREVQEAFEYTGAVRTRVEARGLFGVLGNRLYSIDVDGKGLKTDRLPFIVVPRSGWKGSIRHLRLHFSDFTLKNLPIHSFDADIPNVTYDLGHALYRDRLVIRGAGEGPAVVRIGPDGLRAFILQKYNRAFTEITVTFPSNRVELSGTLVLFGTPTRFHAIGDLEARAGQYIDLKEASVDLNGKPAGSIFVQNTLRQINPVLDLFKDLGLEGYFRLSRVEISSQTVTVYGRASIPEASRQTN